MSALGITRLLQAVETPPPTMRDAQGNVIPSNPENLPYKKGGGDPNT